MRKIPELIFLMAAGLSFLTTGAFADWSAAKRITWTLDDSRYPAVAVDSAGNIHLVWNDLTPGNEEIYYKKGN